jgi:2-oxoglutarate dehydrogenase E2 component (dihydrolipoamide succinyltransferase)
MSLEVKVPVLPESVSDATIATWHKKAGDAVKRDENLVDLETDKVVLEVPSPVDGVLKEIKFETGATVTSQQVIAMIEEGRRCPGTDDAAEAPKAAAAAKPLQRPPPRRPIPRASRPPGASPGPNRTRSIPPRSGTGRRGQVTKEDLVNHMRDRAGVLPRRRACRRARADDPHAHPHRRAPDAVEELHRHADLVQRGQPRAR